MQASFLPSPRAISVRSPFGHTVLRLVLLIALFLLSPSAPAQEKETAIGAFADLIGKAVRRAVGEEEPVAVEEVVAEEAFEDVAVMLAPAAAAGPPAADIDRRKVRLVAYTAAMMQWMDGVCELSDEQKTQLQAIVDAEIQKSQTAFEKQDPRKRQNQALLDTFPVKFTMRYGVAQNVDLVRQPRKLSDILTEEQLGKLKEAAAERRAIHVNAMLDRVTNLLDEELYLTKSQREQIREPLRRSLRGMEDASYSMSSQSYYYKQTPISTLLQRGEHLKVLNEAQQRRARDFSSPAGGSTYSSEQYLSFQSQESDKWPQKLDDASRSQRERVHRACAVRAAFFQEEMGLGEEESRHLMVAGKGIADRLIADWKKKTRQQLKAYEEQAARFGGSFGFSVHVANIQEIEESEIWKHTVKRLTANKGSASDPYDRFQAIRKANARFLTALFDRELWLSREQRESVREKIEACLPTGYWQNPYRNYMDEVSLLVIPLFKFSKRDASIFVGDQKKAWESLRGEFDFNGDYVLVHIRNGGQIHFQIPD